MLKTWGLSIIGEDIFKKKETKKNVSEKRLKTKTEKQMRSNSAEET